MFVPAPRVHGKKCVRYQAACGAVSMKGASVKGASPGATRTAPLRYTHVKSLTLLSLPRLQLVYIHDPEYAVMFEQAMAPRGTVAGLLQCRDEGLIEHVGIASGPIALMTQFVKTGAFEVILSHNRYTLLNIAASP